MCVCVIHQGNRRTFTSTVIAFKLTRQSAQCVCVAILGLVHALNVPPLLREQALVLTVPSPLHLRPSPSVPPVLLITDNHDRQTVPTCGHTSFLHNVLAIFHLLHTTAQGAVLVRMCRDSLTSLPPDHTAHPPFLTNSAVGEQCHPTPLASWPSILIDSQTIVSLHSTLFFLRFPHTASPFI